MSKEENIINYYLLCNKLKHVIRTGWINWNVNSERLESVAEHVFGVEMLALAIYSEYGYYVDIEKVIYMLAIHEIGESVIGDITMFDLPREEKERIEHEAVHNILKGLVSGEEIEELFCEFDEHRTRESVFAYQCDKLEADLQAKIYSDENSVDLNNQENNDTMNDPMVKELLDSGESFGTMWMKFSQEHYPYDKNFRSISDYAMKRKLSK